MTRQSHAAAPADDAAGGKLPLTAGVIAMTNLQAQIDGRQRQIMAGQQEAADDQAELIELVALRGEILSRISDYEWAGERAEQLTRDAPADGIAFITRARARGRFHRFTDALADLDRAQRLGADPAVVGAERASVFQALGYYDAAFTLYEASTRPADPDYLGVLATLHAERGETTVAEQLFDQSQDRYRGVSPIPLALLDLRRGLMWLTQGDLCRARAWFDAAVHRLPALALAQGRRAEVEAALGHPEAAITRLRPLTTSSDDPRYAASLARILRETGKVHEAAEWRDKAAKRYDELAARHPEAFADHAAEFRLHADSSRVRLPGELPARP